MAYNSVTLTAAEAGMLQCLLVEDLQNNSAGYKGGVANVQAVLDLIRAHVASKFITPLVLTGAQASIVQTKIAAAPVVVKTTATTASVITKLSR